MRNGTWNNTESVDVIESARWIEIISAICLLIVFVLGVLENSVILYVFARNKQFVTPNNIPVMAMLFNALCHSALALPLPLTAELSGGWYVSLSEFWCTFEAFIVYLFGLTSLYLLFEITLLRYVTITRPMESAQMTNKHALIGVCLGYTVAAGFAICPLLGFGSYGLEAHGTSCGLAWDDRSSSGKTYLIVIFIFCFLLPISLMVTFYAGIFKVVKKSSVFPSENASSLRLRRQQERERKLLKLSIIMVSTYLFCWTPYAIVSFCIAFGDPGVLHPVVTRLPALLAKSEVLWNPIIYTLQTKQFRNKVYQMVPCHGLRERLQRADNEVTQIQMSQSSNVNNIQDEGTSRSDSARKPVSNAGHRTQHPSKLFVVEEERKRRSDSRDTVYSELPDV